MFTNDDESKSFFISNKNEIYINRPRCRAAKKDPSQNSQGGRRLVDAEVIRAEVT